jgi:hypothetical protein
MLAEVSLSSRMLATTRQNAPATLVYVLKNYPYLTELLGFWTLSIVRILIVTRKKKNKHDVSETGSVSVLR